MATHELTRKDDPRLVEVFSSVSAALDKLESDDARVRVLAAVICLHDAQFALGTIRRFTRLSPNLLGERLPER